jgi:hypothetical protein
VQPASQPALCARRGVQLPLLVLPPTSHAEAPPCMLSLLEPAIEKYQSQYRKEIYEQ